MKAIFLVVMVMSAVLMGGCNKDEGINFFSVQDDIDFGKQMADEIAKNPTEYPILKPSEHPTLYAKLNAIVDKIRDSGELNHRDDFAWDVVVINKPVINAFATPGGYIYIYTGLMKYLDNEAQLAGVIGHEMAHADLRHSTQQLTKQYGFSILASTLLGENAGQLATIASQLAQGLSSLAFSRDDEYEADEYSVRYLVKTNYDPRGAQGFFQKMMNESNTSNVPVFLQTHPNDADRIANITKIWQKYGSKTGETLVNEYAAYKAYIP